MTLKFDIRESKSHTSLNERSLHCIKIKWTALKLYQKTQLLYTSVHVIYILFWGQEIKLTFTNIFFVNSKKNQVNHFTCVLYNILINHKLYKSQLKMNFNKITIFALYFTRNFTTDIYIFKYVLYWLSYQKWSTKM